MKHLSPTKIIFSILIMIMMLIPYFLFSKPPSINILNAFNKCINVPAIDTVPSNNSVKVIDNRRVIITIGSGLENRVKKIHQDSLTPLSDILLTPSEYRPFFDHSDGIFPDPTNGILADFQVITEVVSNVTGGAVLIKAVITKGGSLLATTSIKKLVNKNSNDATGKFGVYIVEVAGKLFKVGKADLGRVTVSSGLPTRIHQQVRKLGKKFGRDKVQARVVSKTFNTTREAKRVERSILKKIYKQLNFVPPGNKKSFKPKA